MNLEYIAFRWKKKTQCQKKKDKKEKNFCHKNWGTTIQKSLEN